MKKRIFAIFLTLCLTLSLAACSSGGSSEQSSQPQESSQTQEPSSAVNDEPEETASTPEETEETSSEATEEQPLKGMRDDLTDADIQALKDAIGKAVLSEYCEPNNIAPADFSWDVFTSGEGSGYYTWMDDLYGKIQESGEYTVQVDDARIERVTPGEGADDTEKVTAAVCNGVLDYLNTQAPYNVGYYSSMSRVLVHICDFVETIDLTALVE